MARGISSTGDLLTRLGDGTDLNRLWADYSEVVKEFNARRDTLSNLLTFKTTLAVDAVLQSFTGASFEDATEYGIPVASRPTVEGVELGYTFKFRDAATRFTWQFLASATREQTDAITNSVLEADNKQLFQAVLSALLNNVARTNEKGAAVYPLWNGDAMVPPEHDGQTFGVHSHYVTSGTASLSAAGGQIAVDALMELVLEHGYGDGTNGQLVLLVNRVEGNQIRTFRSVAGGGEGSYDFIPGDGAPARLTSESVVGDTPPAKIGDLPLIGAYGPAFVGISSLVPAGYVIAVATGGPNSAFNPVAIRQHPQANLQGLKLLGGDNNAYPIIDSTFLRGFGTGVRHRGAAAVMQVTANPAYAVPAGY
ncbi:hypothetical protein [Nocardioides humi]|uniref:Uncharacterized protein n=1 Tax=Nocardioides humi TaxID=449461 RepID=A0ABN2BMV4_9ACTN|nr:hypothetical protein [Nocardioides humi]